MFQSKLLVSTHDTGSYQFVERIHLLFLTPHGRPTVAIIDDHYSFIWFFLINLATKRSDKYLEEQIKKTTKKKTNKKSKKGKKSKHKDSSSESEEGKRLICTCIANINNLGPNDSIYSKNKFQSQNGYM